MNQGIFTDTRVFFLEDFVAILGDYDWRYEQGTCLCL